MSGGQQIISELRFIQQFDCASVMNIIVLPVYNSIFPSDAQKYSPYLEPSYDAICCTCPKLLSMSGEQIWRPKKLYAIIMMAKIKARHLVFFHALVNLEILDDMSFHKKRKNPTYTFIHF